MQIQVSVNNNRCSSCTHDFYNVPLASQTWTLGRLLPMMVGDKILEDDEYWQHYLTTLEIADYILAPGVLPEEVAYLNVLLTEHHTTFVSLYPEASFIPKMHFLLHVPCLMLKLVCMCSFVDM